MRTRLILALAAGAGLLGRAPDAHAQTYANQVLQQLEAMSQAQRGFTLENYIIGHLAQGRADSWTFALAENTKYLITGACDTDCSDVDIIVEDANGDVVVKDDTEDDVPVVTIETKAAGQYTVNVYMYTCETKTCYFGFGLMKQAR